MKPSDLVKLFCGQSAQLRNIALAGRCDCDVFVALSQLCFSAITLSFFVRIRRRPRSLILPPAYLPDVSVHGITKLGRRRCDSC